MGREAAIICDWDFPKVGRENVAEQVFREFLTYWEQHAVGGSDAGVTVWFHSDGASAIVVIRGESNNLFSSFESEECERILNKVHYVFRRFDLHFYWGGSTASADFSVDLFRQAGRDLGII